MIISLNYYYKESYFIILFIVDFCSEWLKISLDQNTYRYQAREATTLYIYCTWWNFPSRTHELRGNVCREFLISPFNVAFLLFPFWPDFRTENVSPLLLISLSLFFRGFSLFIVIWRFECAWFPTSDLCWLALAGSFRFRLFPAPSDSAMLRLSRSGTLLSFCEPFWYRCYRKGSFFKKSVFFFLHWDPVIFF